MKHLSRVLTGAIALLGSMSAPADFFHETTGSIDGDLCVGAQCLMNENVGRETIRLKEANPRIHFNDTNTDTGGFPNNDWRIIANDNFKDGESYFAVEDATAGNIPFRVEAGAPSDSLYVDDGGRLGLGTNTPVVDLHVKSGGTPTLRLEQDGSSGFTPQTWDVAGNDTNFFIRDATNGSKEPFRIRTSAPFNSFYIDTDGAVGMGTDNPLATLHIIRAIGDADLLIENTGTGSARLELENANRSWWINSNNNLRITTGGSQPELQLDPTSGNMTIQGSLTTGGSTCGGGGCDMVFAPETRIESIEEHASQMWSNSYLPAVGPTVENTPINITEKTGGMLNELEKAHIYIEQLHERSMSLEQRVEAMQRQLNELLQ